MVLIAYILARLSGYFTIKETAYFGLKFRTFNLLIFV